MLTVACVLRSGGIFTPLWVERLKRQVDAFIKPDRFVCLTDGPCGCDAVPLAHSWPGWFAKMELFRPNVFDPSETVLYLDLDTLVLRPLPGIEQGGRTLMLLDDFYQPRKPASGVMLWRPSAATEQIYRSFVARPEIQKGWTKGDGAIIGRHPHDRLQKAWPYVFGSYKAHDLRESSKGFAVCCFHGTPKQHELPADSWARRYWETSNR